ncbi:MULTISPECIES: glycine betaine ABC transporter substrate-binding protein [unclassified Paenibacillus]|uniref:ABC transporter substrate-binding protein n=1 Tax=unclassified Paenibacillus TaxID=185978 RepID=UPI0021178CE0|nr:MULTISPECIES: glycine betaine ABC transporter substrate-binding protein [unclassified Paenibacillus]
MKKIVLAVLIFAGTLLSACGSSGNQPSNEAASGENVQPARITVGGKPFTEQLILVQLMAQLLDAKTGHTISTAEGLGSSNVLMQALKDDDIQVYADYTGTGYINILKNELKPDDTPETVYEKAKQGYEEQFGFTWLNPIKYSNTFTLIMKREKADALGVKTFSDLVRHAPNLVLGSDAQFFERGDGYKGMAEKYGFEFKGRKEMDIGIAYQALTEGQIDVLVGYSTDGRIPALELQILEDDKGYFPPYYPAPILKMEFLKKYPEVGETLNLLADKLDETTMAELNAKVDVKKEEPKDVAANFLKQAGLIE